MKLFPENISVPGATALQEQLADQVILADRISLDINSVAGIVPYSRGHKIRLSGALLDFPSLQVKKTHIIEEDVEFPDVPTFEGFRMGKAMVDLLDEIGKPDILIVFGHGINHPRRFGVACHIGMCKDIPTIGISRDTPCGVLIDSNSKKILVDDEQVIGEQVQLSPLSPLLYISPGYRITLDTAVDLTKKLTREKLPEPILVAQKQLLSQLTV